MGNIGPFELFIIFIAIILIFGGKKLPELARNLGLGSLRWYFQITGIHADLSEPHLSFLLYLNDSDGDTTFFREKWNDAPGTRLTKWKTVSPKKNRVVISDGNYHASQNPINSEIRIVLNAVIKIKENNDES